MKLMIVAMPQSVHTARWVRQLVNEGWEIHLFPSAFDRPTHALLAEVVDWKYAWTRFFGAKLKPGKIHLCANYNIGPKFPVIGKTVGDIISRRITRYLPDFQKIAFRRALRKFKPDLVHSLEFQEAGALCLRVKKSLKTFPKWIATNWGSDVFLFGRLPWSKQVVLDILAECSVYSCECQRDVELARSLGFKGSIWPVLPNTGGLDLDKINAVKKRYLNQPRKLIMFKGYNGWSGRAVFVVQAFKKCAELLKDYEIVLFSSTADTQIALELAHQENDLSYRLVPHNTPHEEILELFGQARMYIGAGISDGISTSCLEAMAMGAFPIQSKGSCCTEWFVDGKSGISFDGENIDEMVAAIQRVLTDDSLCKTAQEMNGQIVNSRLDQKVIGQKVIANYQTSLELS